ncbi:DUF6702 family protein [Maricaulis parjimensis]|uniref:DUF6702 family protein n=1 Tax=Maricaulis parjimensis TaxID=144023 RepID=UPI00193A92F2|nr:DUF6702 family protein [Maricaulis parjimensis]
MRKLRLRTWMTVLAGMLLLAAPASAHRVHAGVTEISVNPRTGEMEVIHRVYGHDLLEAVGEESEPAETWLQTEAGLAAIGEYAATYFRMGDSAGNLIDLTYIGAEADGEFAWIYFSAPAPDSQAEFIVDNDLLADHFDDQVMMTNLRFNSLVRTAMQGPGRRAPVRVSFER